MVRVSSVDKTLFSVQMDGQLTFEDERAAIRFVETVTYHSGFCEWCLAPTVRSHRLDGLQLSTVATYDQYTNLTADYPPDQVDGTDLVEVSRDELKICDCGVIDHSVSDSRDRETLEDALTHLLALLEENGADLTRRDRRNANDIVDSELAKGHTGQHCEVLGSAIREAIS